MNMNLKILLVFIALALVIYAYLWIAGVFDIFELLQTLGAICIGIIFVAGVYWIVGKKKQV